MVVLENCLDRAVEVLLNGLEKDVFVSSEAGEGEEARVRFASLLPGLSRWSSLALKSIPCELVDVSNRSFGSFHLQGVEADNGLTVECVGRQRITVSFGNHFCKI